ncbi:TPA: hypothetical protein HA278_07810 [Candidatus Woesearchaeota archaeon]|nr:hypothetical protein [archaeon]HIJ11937.1 hypothetical protein [Candidatus Woesearchaeota archaeon]
MDIRNVQKTGDMFYLYLPTRWCKKYNINGKSKVGVQANKDGSLGVHPQLTKRKPATLNIKASSDNIDSLQKLTVACYISPADSFKISLDKELDFTTILHQKNMVSLELVEIDGNHISCESSLKVNDPASLLLTMIRKVRNLLLVMQKKAPRELIERYESEIDRSKLLIDKAVLGAFVNPAESNNTTVELHFLSLISKSLESMVDHIIALKVPPERFLKSIMAVLGQLQELLKDASKQLTTHNAMAFVEAVSVMQGIKVQNVASYDKRRTVRALNSIAEVILDWAVVKEVS